MMKELPPQHKIDLTRVNIPGAEPIQPTIMAHTL